MTTNEDETLIYKCGEIPVMLTLPKEDNWRTIMVAIEEHTDFALWTQQCQKDALKLIQQNDFVFDGQNGEWEQLAFILYTQLCEIEQKSRHLLDEDNTTNTQILSAAIELWGVEMQKIIAMEECGELIQALCKDLRGNSNMNNIVEEIADVKICIDSLELIYMDADTTFVDRVKMQKQRKMSRVETWIEREINNQCEVM